MVLGLLRFGFVAIYLTEPLVRGFTTAASMHVVISQLKYLLGVKTQRFSGPLSAIYVSMAFGGTVGGKGFVRKVAVLSLSHKFTLTVLFLLPQSVKAVFSDITSTNVTALIVGLVCLVFLFVIKDLNERFKKKLPVPIPGEIIIVIVSTSVSYAMSLSEHYSVDVVGTIPTG